MISILQPNMEAGMGAIDMSLKDQYIRGLSTVHPIGVHGSTKEKHQYDVMELEDEGCSLVLHNDGINTFAHVIACLMKYCGHSSEQAEQCAWIVHLKGKCSVKSGSYEDLLPMHAALGDQGLQVTIE